MMDVCKLIIWDLDDTFWKGTLSEGNVEIIESNVTLLKELVDRGIMNSIVSKNDYSEVMNVLEREKIKEYFIFPKISWQAKGNVVKELLQECGLRAENTIFVDDNASNREEVKYYNPNITCVEPEYFLGKDILDKKEFKGKCDKNKTRLKQYHDLEKRSSQQKKYSSAIEFLKSAGICITINDNCYEQIDRIYELITRTNQLNFTKNRISKEELTKLCLDDTYQKGYVCVRDNFGDYGIVGFYCLKNKQLEHFLFSCRILGFYVENYVYRLLGKPDINVKHEVAVNLDYATDIDWIRLSDDDINVENSNVGLNSKHSILMIAGCDLEGASRYLESEYEITKEFATVVDGYAAKTSNLWQLKGIKELSLLQRQKIAGGVQFFNNQLTFGSKIFSGKYDTIILSVVDEYIRAYFRHKEEGFLISFGAYWDWENYLAGFNNRVKDSIMNDYEYIGRRLESDFQEDLEYIIEQIPNNTHIIIINGTDIDVSDWIGRDRIQRNIDMNKAVDSVIEKYTNVSLVDMRKIVTSRDDLTRHDNRHFSRRVYFDMAKKIAEMCSDADKNISVKNIRVVQVQELLGHIKSKLGRLYRKIF